MEEKKKKMAFPFHSSLPESGHSFYGVSVTAQRSEQDLRFGPRSNAGGFHSSMEMICKKGKMLFSFSVTSQFRWLSVLPLYLINTETHPLPCCKLFFLYFFFQVYSYVCVCLVTQLYMTLCDPMDYSPSGSSIHGILQARILESVAIPFSTCFDRCIFTYLVLLVICIFYGVRLKSLF